MGSQILIHQYFKHICIHFIYILTKVNPMIKSSSMWLKLYQKLTLYCLIAYKKITTWLDDDQHRRLCFYSCLGGFCLLALLLIWVGANKSLWGDEQFTIFTINSPWEHMWKILREDFHPPGYYLLLRGFLAITKPLLGIWNQTMLAKFFSYSANLILAGVGGYYLYRRKHPVSSVIFTLIILTGPLLLPYGFEIRMYSWSMLAVTLTYLASLECLEKPTLKNFALLLASTLLAVYTQYYAAISVIIIWGLLGWHFYRQHNFDALKTQFITGLLVILGFGPWLPSFWEQLNSLDRHPLGTFTFPLTLNNSWHLISAPFTPIGAAPSISTKQFDFNPFSFIFVLAAIAAYYYLAPKQKSYRYTFAFLAYGLTVLVGIGLYFFNIPIFPRYLFPLCGCLAFATSMLFAQSKEFSPHLLPGLAAVLITVVTICIVNIIRFIIVEYHYNQDTLAWLPVIEEIKEATSETVVAYDYNTACLLEKVVFLPDTNNLDCKTFYDADFANYFYPAIKDKDNFYIVTFLGNCSREEKLFRDNGFDPKLIFRSYTLENNCDHHSNLCAIQMVTPQCIFHVKLDASDSARINGMML